jgi:hypothetical protein
MAMIDFMGRRAQLIAHRAALASAAKLESAHARIMAARAAGAMA